jgi:NAD(P)H-hydrate repair Nnr-like enzyme with NAD(P)H-hydrate dehydratase domain
VEKRTYPSNWKVVRKASPDIMIHPPSNSKDTYAFPPRDVIISIGSIRDAWTYRTVASIVRMYFVKYAYPSPAIQLMANTANITPVVRKASPDIMIHPPSNSKDTYAFPPRDVITMRGRTERSPASFACTL